MTKNNSTNRSAAILLAVAVAILGLSLVYAGLAPQLHSYIRDVTEGVDMGKDSVKGGGTSGGNPPRGSKGSGSTGTGGKGPDTTRRGGSGNKPRR